MRLSSLIIVPAVFVIAGLFSTVAAYFSSFLIEDTSVAAVRSELDRDAVTWANVDANGLQIFLIGTAPTEAARFQALSAAGRAVDTARVIDQINVTDTDALTPPRFSVEILRNDAGLSLIGLVPASADHDALISSISRRVGSDVAISDFLEKADFPVPNGWEDALDFAISSLASLPRSKISVEAGRVDIKAMVDSGQAQSQLEADLIKRAPGAVKINLDLTAPRPVITPFTLRFVMGDGDPHFDACSADTTAARTQILAAAVEAGMTEETDCKIGLGVPTRRWGEAVQMAIQALAKINGESVTFSDADISLIAREGTDKDLFDQVVGELENTLPRVFVLTAKLPVTQDATEEGPPEFVATLSPEGDVQLRGRIGSEMARVTTDSVARALFGSTAIRSAARIDETLPASWSVRVLASLEALNYLANGLVTVTPDNVRVSGDTGNASANADIASLLAAKLKDGADFEIDVTYQEKLDPTLGIPTPEECEVQIKDIIGSRKISFEPGAATFDISAQAILDDVSLLLKLCGDIPLEISGHTDSQGRETMNQQLSQDRAQAVLDALAERRVFTSSYTAVGYGESSPIAENDTEEGREANRRIEFTLIRPEPEEQTETPLENAEQSSQEDVTQPKDTPANE